MHQDNPSRWSHEHVFDRGNPGAERGTRAVVWITLAAMLLEIVAGWWFNSMALLADGWHMGTHALAIGLSALAYAAARRYARDRRFAFGSWKIEVLGSFASAVLLAGVAVLMLVGSVERLFEPQPIQYREALVVAIVGLVVNLVCMTILGRADHAHAHAHAHDHHAHDHVVHLHLRRHGDMPTHHPVHAAGDDAAADAIRDQAPHDGHRHADGDGKDLNLHSAYLHVITDAVTSVLAVGALVGGWWLGWDWLDPMMGIVGAVLIVIWSKSLIGRSATILLDREMDHPLVERIRETVERHRPDAGSRVVDLHLWRVGRNAFSCALTVVTHDAALDAAAIRSLLSEHAEIAHATVEIHLCRGDDLTEHDP